MLPNISLKEPKGADLIQVKRWLNDPDVNQMWYGCDESNQPLHTGYTLGFQDSDTSGIAERLLGDNNRDVISVFSEENGHVGEGQLVYEWPLLEAQLFLLIGQKDLWHHHLGTAALLKLLDYAFYERGLHRVWVDVPEYNTNALQMVDHIGFVMEGHFRGAHRKNNEWFDSTVLGLLNDEYARRRSRILESA
jgi:RimJ/RimL family protein N-acetyltransferase